MKKELIVLVLALCLAGCGADGSRKSTVIYIPADSRQPVQTVTSAGREEVPRQTEASAPEATGAAKIRNTGTVKKSSSKETEKGGSSQISATEEPTEPRNSKPSNSKPQSSTITKPAETQPVATEPGATVPPVTEPLSTEPPTTEPPVTEPPVTELPTTEPPATEPPTTEPPVAEPPATELPETEPPVTEPPLYDISGYEVGSLELAILDRINEYRAGEGLPELYLDYYLSAIASCRSYEACQVWSHTRPDGRGYATVLTDYGYSAGKVSELLAYASGDAAATVDKWMSSESHREILLGDFEGAGIGIFRSHGFTYVTCLLVG